MKTKRYQLWCEDESVEGTIDTPTVADALYAIDVKAKPEYDVIDLSRVANSLDREATLIGQKRWTVDFGLDFKGGGNIAGVPNLPECDRLLRMSGMQITQCAYITGVAITGTIAHGETFTQATSGATGVIIGSYSGTPTRIHYVVVSGTVVHTSVITCSGGATFAPANPTGGTNHGYRYRPVTDQWSDANRNAWTGSPVAGEIILSSGGSTSGVALLLDLGVPAASAGAFSADVLLGSFSPSPTTLLTAPEVAGGPVVLDVTPGTGPSFAGLTVVVGFGTANAEVCTVTGTAADTVTVATLANSHSAGAVVCQRILLTGQTSGATCSLLSNLLQVDNCSGSLAWLLDGQAVYIQGVRCDWKIPMETGKPLRIDFTARGFQAAVTTQQLGSAAYVTTPPPRFVSANFTLDSRGFYISKLTLAGGNNLGNRPDANSAEGSISYRISDRDMTITIDPENVVPAGYDFLAKAAASTLVGCKMRFNVAESGIHNMVLATYAGSVIWIDVPAIQYDPPSYGDREGTVTAEITGRIRRGSAAGDDALSIYFL